jgi:hypothetical protein
MREIVKDYLWFYKLDDIDNAKLYDTCVAIDKKLRTVFPPVPDDNFYGCFTSYYHSSYNLFTFTSPELHKLYKNLVKNVLPHVDQNTQYYIRCWVNLFEPGMNIDWHGHWRPECKAYHGFYCVNTEGVNDSYTDYRIPGQQEIRVMSEDGLLVFGKSDDDRHRSSPWENSGKCRMTIAFDVIPIEALNSIDYTEHLLHNYIPLTDK